MRTSKNNELIDITEDLFYKKYKMLCLNMFKWEGLPDTILSKNIEKSLYKYGLCLIVNDKNLGFISVGANYTGNMNVNEEYTQVTTNGYNYIKTFDYIGKDKDSTQLILNNDLAIPNHDYIRYYAKKMAEVEKVIRANINHQKFPWFIPCTPNTKKSVELMFKKVDNLEPLILGDKSILEGGLEVLTLNTPYLADKLNEYKYEVEREVLTFLGLNNSFEKKERLVTSEVDVNNGFIEANINMLYNQRLIACENMNKKFGWNVTVKKNYEMEAEIDEIDLENDGYSKR